MQRAGDSREPRRYFKSDGRDGHYTCYTIGMSNTRFTDEQWAVIESHLPKHNRMGRPRADDRRTLEGILWVLRTGAPWAAMPEKYGSYVTCWRRLKAWEEQGVWHRIWQCVLSSLDAQDKLAWAQAFIDGSFAPAKKGEMR